MDDTPKQESPSTVKADTTVVGDWIGELPPDKSQATRQHRIQQGLWRTKVARWPPGQPQDDRRVKARYETLPNWLAAMHQGVDVRDVGTNLMSPEARAYTRERLPVLSVIDGKAELDRLWRNLLSSQPLAFSIAGHLHRRRTEAAALLAEPQPVAWSRYESALTALGLDRSKTAGLVADGCSQVLRQIMITDSIRRGGLAAGVSPNGRVDMGLAVVLAREDDNAARRVVAALNDAVGAQVPVSLWSHRQLFTAAAKVEGLHEWARAMAARFLLDNSQA